MVFEEKNLEENQSIVDSENSAIHLKWGSKDAIVDHRCQDFINLPSVVPYETRAYIEGPTSKKEYICTEASKARLFIKEGYRFVDDDHLANFINNIADENLCIYTCAGEHPATYFDVYATYWELVESD